MDVMYFHPAVSEVSLRTAALLCLTAAYPPALGVRTVELLSRRAAAGAGEEGGRETGRTGVRVRPVRGLWTWSL